MPSTQFVTILNQPFEVKPASDFYFDKVTAVIANYGRDVSVKMLNECAEAVKTAIIPSVGGSIISYNPITGTYYWCISEDEISEVLLQIYEARLNIQLELLIEKRDKEQDAQDVSEAQKARNQLMVDEAKEKLASFQEARGKDASETTERVTGREGENQQLASQPDANQVDSISLESTEQLNLRELQRRAAQE